MSDIIIDMLPNGLTEIKQVKAGFQPGENHNHHKRKNTKKQPANLGKVIRKIMYIAQWNTWKYFVTLTIDRNRFANKSDTQIMETVRQFMQNENKRQDVSFKYIFVVEYGKNGQIHLHGLMTDIPKNGLRKFAADEPLPKEVRNLIGNDKKAFEWLRYSQPLRENKPYGFSCIVPVGDAIGRGFYLIKGINKDNHQLMGNFNGHAYFHSQGLNCEPERVLRGRAAKSVDQPDYVTDWCRGKKGLMLEDAMEYMDMDDFENITAGRPSATDR